MTRRITGFWMLLASMAAHEPAAANCSCQCVEGVARTVCTSIDEARANPTQCRVGAAAIACSAAPTAVEPPQRYAAPSGASDCRERRVWDPATNAYTLLAKICDLDATPGA